MNVDGTSGWGVKPLSLRVEEKGLTSDGYNYYSIILDDSGNTWKDEKKRFVVIDMRDDVYSPNITEGDYITPYMIFVGLQNDLPVYQIMVSSYFYYKEVII